MIKPIGSLVNALVVAAGAAVGLTFGEIISPELQKLLFQAIGLSILLMGFGMALKAQTKTLLIVGCLLLGSLVGHLLNLSGAIESGADTLKAWVAPNDALFSQGLITAFLLFCTGPMTLLGAIEEGLSNKRDLLLTKSVIDGVAALILAATMGAGVIFSCLPLLIFQGSITLFASSAQQFFTPKALLVLEGFGGLLIAAIGFNLLINANINVSNMLPGLVFAVFLSRKF